MSTTSKQRYISTSFWVDPFIQETTPSEKLVFMYLLTNPLTNIAGVYEITIRQISFDTGFTPEIIREILRRFDEAGKVFHFQNYIIIRNYPNHQKYESRGKIRQGIENVLANLSPEVLQFLVKIGYTYPIHTVGNYSEFEFDSEFESDPESEVDPLPAETVPGPVEEEMREEEPAPSGPSAFEKIDRFKQPPVEPEVEAIGVAQILASEWYQTYSKKTARALSYSERDIREACELLKRTDLQTARDAIPIYFDSTAWFMYDKGKKSRRFSFLSFCRNFAELSSEEAAPAIDYSKIEAASF